MLDVHIIHIDGRSYRLREIDGLLRPSNPTPSNCANLGVYKTDSGIFLAESLSLSASQIEPQI